MFGLGIQELIIVGVVAVILFGKRLPEVARSVGMSYREFRQGLSDIQSQLDVTGTIYNTPTPSTPPREEIIDDYEEPTAPKFELPPQPEASAEPTTESP